MLRRILQLYLLVIVFAISGTMLQGCGKGGSTQPSSESSSGLSSQSGATQPSRAPVTQNPFERDLQFIRNGQFTHVWVFSRRDGKPIDKDDAAYLRKNAPQVVDWVTTDEGKKVIAGTNFDLEKSSLPLLRERFLVEDYTGR